MASLSVQDLAFYSDGGLFGNGLQFVSSTIDVSSTWMTQLLCGRRNGPVTLITFQNHNNVHDKGLKKYGIEPTIQKSQFQHVDLSDKIYNAQLQRESLDRIAEAIDKAVALQTTPTIIVENPELLVSAGHHPLEIVSLITKLESSGSGCVVCLCNSDEELVSDGTPIADQMHLFISQVIHKSSLFVSLRPFETGRADDVTGVLKVVSGPRVVQSTVSEGEYLYLVSNDSVKLFHR